MTEESSSATPVPQRFDTTSQRDVRHCVRVSNAEHMIEVETNQPGLTIQDVIDPVKREAMDLCDAVPVTVGIEYVSEEASDERDRDPSVH